jgi:hypothetical protein
VGDGSGSGRRPGARTGAPVGVRGGPALRAEGLAAQEVALYESEVGEERAGHDRDPSRHEGHGIAGQSPRPAPPHPRQPELDEPMAMGGPRMVRHSTSSSPHAAPRPPMWTRFGSGASAPCPAKELLEEQGVQRFDRKFQDPTEVAAGLAVTQQGPGLGELVGGRRAGGEGHLVRVLGQRNRAAPRREALPVLDWVAGLHGGGGRGRVARRGPDPELCLGGRTRPRASTLAGRQFPDAGRAPLWWASQKPSTLVTYTYIEPQAASR